MDVVVTMNHMRRAQYCSRGVRTFFKEHNLDWDTFLREGVAAEVLEETGDAMAISVAAIARKEQE